MSLRAWAAPGTDTPTATPTDSPSPTVTATPTATPGPGSWSLSMPSPLVIGDNGYSAQWTYVNGPDPISNGRLDLFFPLALSAPVGNTNFWIQPSQNALVSGYTTAGHSIQVDVNGLAAGASVVFNYGYNATGFTVAGTPTTLSDFQLYANPSSQAAAGGLVAPSTAPAIAVLAASPTSTVTPTVTITATYTVSPTITPTFTVTQTYTETPVGAAPAAGTVYCYPNPFDLRLTDKVTIRFNPAASAEVQIFNLVGEPVRKLDPQDIYASQGWALWHGKDDYLRFVTGGIYFVRVRTPDGTLIRKFTVLR